MEDSSTKGHRANLSLRMEGVAAHDELLFKSLVRLLSYRTEHNWTFATDKVDLRVIGEETTQSPPNAGPASILWVGHSKLHRTPFLHLPIHANELELLLNTLGGNILAQQKTAHQPSSFLRDELFMLQRWPPVSLLGSPARIRLATLMTGQPISMNTLVLRSGATAQDCEMFCQELDRAGVLQRHGAPAQPQRDMNEAPALKATPDMSLLSRIRRRLGI
jgi:hypothetical protein